MCPLIRLGNCGGRERGSELERRGQRLYENCFPLRNCNIVTALVSCFFIHCLSSFLSLSPAPPQRKEKSALLVHKEYSGVCLRVAAQRVWFLCVSQTRSSSQTSPPCSDWLPWAQTGSIQRISSPSHKHWNRTPLLDILTKSQLVAQLFVSAFSSRWKKRLVLHSDKIN